MKVLFQDYTFNAATKQITFNTTDVVSLNQVLVITNVTDNVIIYNFADPAKGGVITNNVLTLTYDTTTMSNSDSLQIFLDLYGTPSTDDSVVLLRRLVQLLTPIGVQDAQQRQKVTVESMVGATLSTVQTVSIVNNLAGLGGVDPRFYLIDQSRNTFANGIRQNLTY
jgi:hypothetical protein